jgi:hypothetical protein
MSGSNKETKLFSLATAPELKGVSAKAVAEFDRQDERYRRRVREEGGGQVTATRLLQQVEPSLLETLFEYEIEKADGSAYDLETEADAAEKALRAFLDAQLKTEAYIPDLDTLFGQISFNISQQRSSDDRCLQFMRDFTKAIHDGGYTELFRSDGMKKQQVRHMLKRIKPVALREVMERELMVDQDLKKDPKKFYRKLKKLAKDQERWWRATGAGKNGNNGGGGDKGNKQGNGQNGRQGGGSGRPKGKTRLLGRDRWKKGRVTKRVLLLLRTSKESTRRVCQMVVVYTVVETIG